MNHWQKQLATWYGELASEIYSEETWKIVSTPSTKLA